MDEDRAVALVAAFAALAGREIADAEARATVAHSRALSPGAANAIWGRLRQAPGTVSLRDYLAMTLRFVEQEPPTR
ncbi:MULTISPECIES: hypothetical protein [Pseudonocardia]|uniref:Uncharacterized protein n=2 Tax=Pseudonocardia TaxID=1847 RepID=A0A1Y2N1U3_PSEAH|nr:MULTISPECIES: hypothetical protein [Pseudonocardia]OSY41420.1 hypothetical protein BG845_01911 [Pseudonocardia autotrophica]TDN71377.1 hypothetical protein C8E95_0407 [Pseudonocardia autotrophica]BBG02054.1 hypothetical protein Pdca_32630 [Pseudonocardia autotrophica]GEC24068.1 hypothetical protein PSA01_10970 [Pseudonocardia saturnea]